MHAWCDVLCGKQGVVTAELRPVPILADGASCNGGEDFLTACPGFGIGNNTSCSHESDVSLVCFNGPDPGACPPNLICL